MTAVFRGGTRFQIASQSILSSAGVLLLSSTGIREFTVVANQDEMDQRKEWLDIIARESERLQND